MLASRTAWCRGPHILFNLLDAPPAIFCVLNATNSCFNSSSCFLKSSLFLPQSWAALTLPVVDCAHEIVLASLQSRQSIPISRIQMKE